MLPQATYDAAYFARVSTLPRKSRADVLKLPTAATKALKNKAGVIGASSSWSEEEDEEQFEAVAVEYSSLKDLKAAARQLGLMDDDKAGVVRTGYHGVVETWRGDVKVFLVPKHLDVDVVVVGIATKTKRG